MIDWPLVCTFSKLCWVACSHVLMCIHWMAKLQLASELSMVFVIFHQAPLGGVLTSSCHADAQKGTSSAQGGCHSPTQTNRASSSQVTLNSCEMSACNGACPLISCSVMRIFMAFLEPQDVLAQVQVFIHLHKTLQWAHGKCSN